MTRPLDHLLHHMRAVAASRDRWASGFARSILSQSRRRNWRPSPKQEAVMQRLVAELFREDDGAVIDEGNNYADP